MIGNPKIPRGSALSTEVTRDGDAMDRLVEDKKAWDDPIPEIMVVKLIYYYYSIVHLHYTDTLLYTHRNIMSEIHCHTEHRWRKQR